MARMVGRGTRMPGVEQIQKIAATPSIEEEGQHGGNNNNSDGAAAHQAPKKVISGGRAGMVRTSVSSATFTTSSTHSAAMGRGHNHITLMQQNFKPLLDGSYFVQKSANSAGNSMTASHRSHESTVSRMTSQTSSGSNGLRIENFIYLEIEVFLHEDDKVNSVSQKTLGFDVRQNVRNVMNDICSYIDIENIRPLHMFCKNTGVKLEEGTLDSNKIETEVFFCLIITH
jgi:hypothetical protein